MICIRIALAALLITFTCSSAIGGQLKCKGESEDSMGPSGVTIFEDGDVKEYGGQDFFFLSKECEPHRFSTETLVCSNRDNAWGDQATISRLLVIDFQSKTAFSSYVIVRYHEKNPQKDGFAVTSVHRKLDCKQVE